jgi:hypothetical protein
MAWGVRALTPIKVDRSLSKPLVKSRAPSISPKLSMKGPSNYILLGRLQEALKLKGTIRKAADEVHMPYTTARRWLKGLAQPQISKQRRVGSLDASSDMAAYDLLGNNTTTQAALRLFEDGRAPRVLSKTTIIRAARRHAAVLGVPLRYKRGRPKKELSQRTKAKRLDFAKAHMQRNWRLVMFTDRKKFQFKYPGVKTSCGKWLKGSEEHVASQVNHADTLNVYVGLSPYGMTLAHEVAGTRGLKTAYKAKKGTMAKNITSEEYEAVLKETLLPGGKRLFSQGGGQSCWVLQQDNDPAHNMASSTVASWNTQHASAIQLLQDWPPNSPDLSPIENIWGWVDARVNKKGCSTWHEYKAAVHLAFQQVPRGMIDNLYKSMPQRMQLVMEKGGGKTGY